MTAFPSYSTGTVSIGAGATSIVGTSTIWSGVNARPGDDILVAGHIINIVDVVDPTHLTIDPWPYTAVTAGTAYKVIQRSPLRFAGGQAMADVSTLVATLNSLGPIFNVATGASAPDPSLGADGQYAHQMATDIWWLKTAGVWVVSSSPSGAPSLGAANIFTNTTEATGVGTTASAIFSGGVEILKKLFVTGIATFTASPIIPTATVGDNSTKAASTAFVLANSATLGAANTFTNATEATGAGTTAAAIFSGGVEILKKLFVTGIATFTASPIIPTATALDNTTKAASTAYVDRTTREKLSANRTYFVDNTNGNDSNIGLSAGAGNAFKTIQKAINVCGGLDMTIYTTTIQCAAGTYTGAVTVSLPFLGNVVLLGDTTTPANVILNPTSATACITVSNLASLTVKGFQISNTGAFGLWSTLGATIFYGACDFGACASTQVRLDNQAKVQAIANYRVVGSSPAHITAVTGGIADITNFISGITLVGTPAFSTGFLQVRGLSQVLIGGLTFTGSGTGPHFYADTNAVINLAGASLTTYLPGNAANTQATGAQVA